MNYVEEIKNIFIHWMDEYDENEILSRYNPWGPAGLFNIENGIGKNVNDIIKAYVDYFSSACTFQVDGDEGADFLEIPLLSEIFIENPIKIQIDEGKYVSFFAYETKGIQRIISQQIFEVLLNEIIDSFNKQNVVEAKVLYLENRCFFVIEHEMTKVFTVNDFNSWINNFNDVKIKNGEYGLSSYNEFELTIRFCGKEKQFLEFPRTISMELLVYNDLFSDNQERIVKRTFKLELDKNNIIHLINMDKVTDEEFDLLIEDCKKNHIIKEGYFTAPDKYKGLIRQIVKEDYTYRGIKIVDFLWHDDAFLIASDCYTGGFLIKFNTDIRNFVTNVYLARQFEHLIESARKLNEYCLLHGRFEKIVKLIMKEDYSYKGIKIVDAIFHDEAYNIMDSEFKRKGYGSICSLYLSDGFLIKLNTEIKIKKAFNPFNV